MATVSTKSIEAQALGEAMDVALQSRAIDLPVLPEASTKIIRLCDDPECEPKDLADLVRTDQALMAHLLRVVNSAGEGSAVPIVSLQFAVNRLGLIRIKMITLSIACKSSVFNNDSFRGVVRRLFRHAVATSVCAQEVARLKRMNVEQAFTAGLLHDVGRPILLQLATNHIKNAGIELEPEEIFEVIHERHEFAGAQLAESWSLPDCLVAAIQHHHEPTKAGEHERLARCVRFADQLADHLLGVGGALTERAIHAHPDLAPLNLYPDDVETLLSMKDTIRDSVGALL
ncbi:MAG: HDOD domain-containing protein [Planctomycetes bacterium]|nr:HDOD domain-containing protein [Planctomycetota bacterium]